MLLSLQGCCPLKEKYMVVSYLLTICGSLIIIIGAAVFIIGKHSK